VYQLAERGHEIELSGRSQAVHELLRLFGDDRYVAAQLLALEARHDDAALAHVLVPGGKAVELLGEHRVEERHRAAQVERLVGLAEEVLLQLRTDDDHESAVEDAEPVDVPVLAIAAPEQIDRTAKEIRRVSEQRQTAADRRNCHSHGAPRK
jgi:Flp pilus assembly CpaF family ATPase